jgi:nucleotide-binding universal stress UspA family protein
MNNKSSVRECRWMVSRESEQRATFNQHRLSMRRILAPTDLTSAESGVIDYAVAFSRRFGAELIMLHVHEAKGSGDYSLNVIDDTIVDERRERAEDALMELCAEVNETYPHCDVCFRAGTPSEEIVLAARDLDADLIIVSTHLHHWFTPLIGKSDAEKILRRTPCPVLVVQQDQSQLGKGRC